MYDFEVVEVNFCKCYSIGNMFFNIFQFWLCWFVIEYGVVLSMYGYVFCGGFNENDDMMCLDCGFVWFWGIDLMYWVLGVDWVDCNGIFCLDILLGVIGGGNLCCQWGCYLQWEDIDNCFVVEGYDSIIGFLNDFIFGGIWLMCFCDIEFVGNYVEGYLSLLMLQMMNLVCKQCFVGNFRMS